jgi:CRP-like cAMP-binding protein
MPAQPKPILASHSVYTELILDLDKNMERSKDTLAFLKNNPLFKDFSDEELSLLIPLMHEASFSSGSYLVHEGERGDELFLLKEGEVEIIKKEKIQETPHRIAVFGAGSCIGEMALIDSALRSASVRAITPVNSYALSISRLHSLSKEHFDYSKLMNSLAGHLTQRLRDTNEKVVSSLQAEVESSDKRNQIGHVLIVLSILLYLYALSLKGISIFFAERAILSLFSDLCLFLFGVGMIFVIMKNTYPLSFYGISLRNWCKYALESAYWTLFLLAAITLLKWILIQTIPEFRKYPLIDPFGMSHLSGNLWKVVLLEMEYLLFIPLQELICRGGFQSCFQNFFTGRHHMFWAILITNLYFSFFHLHQTYLFALSAFLLGLFWGWIYLRQGTLVGPCVSHILVGIWAFMILDCQAFFIF